MNMCERTGKLRFDSPGAAEKERKYRRRRGDNKGGRLSTYRCHHCNGWHIGHGDGELRGPRPRAPRR